MMDEAHPVGLVDAGQQNLNDLQNYLVNFNKEIGVHGEGSAFHHSVSQIISQSSQPVFVTVPGSSPDKCHNISEQGMHSRVVTVLVFQSLSHCWSKSHLEFHNLSYEEAFHQACGRSVVLSWRNILKWHAKCICN